MLEKKKIHVTAEPAKNVDAYTLSVEVDNAAPFFLHSRYNPEQEAKDWLATVDVKPDTAYVVLGFGLGYHVQALLSQLDANALVAVVEPFPDQSLNGIAAKILKDKKWLSDPRLVFVAFANLRDISVSISDRLVEKRIYKAVVCPHFSSMQIYPDFYRELLNDLPEELSNQLNIKLNFGMYNTVPLFENAWRNLPEIIKSPGITSFKNKYKNKPAFIVGSGPSLNKNIRLLKEIRNSGLMIACGSALRALGRQEVVPHIFASADPFPMVYESLKEYLSAGVGLLATYDTCFELIKNYPGPKVFARTRGVEFLKEIQQYLPVTDILRKSVSVTTTALDFALYCGCNPIVFVGQDLAYGLNDTKYADGVKDYFNVNACFDVKGADGSTLKAPADFRDLLMYLQTIIQFYPEKIFINSSVGGALIEGCEHLPLEEVRQRYLTNSSIDLDFDCLPVIETLDHYGFSEFLKEIRREALKLKAEVHCYENEFDEWVSKLESQPAFRLIEPIITPIVLYKRYRANEYGEDLADAIAVSTERCERVMDVLVEAINTLIIELDKERQGG